MSSLETAMIKARSAEKRGDFAEAEQIYGGVLRKFPGNPRARRGMDELFKARSLAMLKADAPPQDALDALALAYEQGRLAQVVGQAEALLERHPRSALVHNLLGAAHLTQGEPARAEAALRKAHAAGVRHPALCNNLGMALANLGRHREAIGLYREALTLDPNYAIACNNLGNALKECELLVDALNSYAKALAIRPDYADACSNMGLVLEKLGRIEDARALYLKVLTLAPDHAAAYNNLANLLVDLGDLAGAHEAYGQALRIDPHYPEAHLNRGNLYKRQGRIAEANAAFDSAKAARPNYPDAAAEQGKTLALDGRIDAAIAAFDEALAADPAHAGALTHKLFYQAHACEWSAFADWGKLGPDADAAISPFAALTFEDDPAAQLRRSRAWAAKSFARRPVLAPRPAPAADGRIRIGYFSANFHDHAMIFLMAGLLREHDRGQFAVHAFSYGPPADDAMRRHVIAHTDSFTDVREMSDDDLIVLAREIGLDIAIDLNGYTHNGRMKPFARRLAPVQVSLLGYPGSSGTEFIDYLVADAVVVPAEERAHYSEKLIVMPDSYFPTDDRAAIAADAGTRADHGLPEDGFVFACFNQSYKITPVEFAIWMRLLGQVENSVLWLIAGNPRAEANLRARATEHGIAPERLVFADKRPNAAHVARHVHADLFLDCFNVNAHTTATDALWAGLPVLTLAGRQLAARVAASLLQAVGLPELVTDSAEAYEALALELATRPEELAEIRARLAANRRTHPLFDSTRYARRLESGFATALQRQRDGLAPADIVIAGE
jgi:predicted O-linked N-acetylglucosamine transferase (SPINDLY family)